MTSNQYPCPHPTLLANVVGQVGVVNPTPVGVCEKAKLWRSKLLDSLMCAAAQPEEPVEIEGETFDHAGHVRMLQRLIDWTYKICQLEAEADEGAFMTSNMARRCSRGK